jgi:hypothetical protein
MPALLRTPVRQPLSNQRMMAALRSQLPTPQYLAMLHTLALTGQLPVYEPADPSDPHAPPTPTGAYTPPDRQLQHKTLTYLVDKAFAPIEKPAASMLAQRADQQDDARIITNSADARNLTVGELIRRLTLKDEDTNAQAAQPVAAEPHRAPNA